jgi:hypothetical protein
LENTTAREKLTPVDDPHCERFSRLPVEKKSRAIRSKKKRRDIGVVDGISVVAVGRAFQLVGVRDKE